MPTTAYPTGVKSIGFSGEDANPNVVNLGYLKEKAREAERMARGEFLEGELPDYDRYHGARMQIDSLRSVSPAGRWMMAHEAEKRLVRRDRQEWAQRQLKSLQDQIRQRLFPGL